MLNPVNFFQTDIISLNAYYNKQAVSFEDVKLRLLLKLRELNKGIPDNSYELSLKMHLNDIDNFCDFFISIIPDFSAVFLEMNNRKIKVKEIKFVEWQDIITDVSPLFVQSAFLFQHNVLKTTDKRDILSFFNEYVVQNTKYTALPSPKIKFLDNLVMENHGLNDLHIHLNGITESEIVWQNLLNNTDKNLKNILKRINSRNFRQQLAQLGIDYQEETLYFFLNRAKSIRNKFYNIIIEQATENVRSDEIIACNPFSLFFLNDVDENQKLDLCYEMLMYIIVLHYLSISKNEYVAKLLHEYLLIQGFFLQLIVHIPTQFGFSQFQHITTNNIREESDKNQLRKMLQLSGNDKNFIKFWEFRFAPKEKISEQRKMLNKIEKDFQKFIDIRNIEVNKSINALDYVLIPHFIKTKENNKTNIRFEFFRKELDKRKRVIEELIDEKSCLSQRVVAIDAAASEFDTPPEVFAPVFNELRKEGYISHFTYHAGEDYYHILSGLRAIYEAIVFLNLRHGDRIGHASAAGTDIETWISLVGHSIMIPKGEYMDDMIFSYKFIVDEKIEQLYSLLPFIGQKIEQLCYEIYKSSKSVSFIIKCYELRKFDYKEVLLKAETAEEKDFMEMYNSLLYRSYYEKPVEVAVNEIFSVSQMIILQKSLLRFMHEKEIVIEALPTSNLRIGYHKKLNSYQLFNWYKWEKDGFSIPPIVIGTDDAGIFSTNIYNEYALIYCFLVYEKKMNRNEVISYIRGLYENSELYAFKSLNDIDIKDVNK